MVDKMRAELIRFDSFDRCVWDRNQVCCLAWPPTGSTLTNVKMHDRYLYIKFDLYWVVSCVDDLRLDFVACRFQVVSRILKQHSPICIITI